MDWMCDMAHERKRRDNKSLRKLAWAKQGMELSCHGKNRLVMGREKTWEQAWVCWVWKALLPIWVDVCIRSSGQSSKVQIKIWEPSTFKSLSPVYLTSMQSTSWEMLGWKKHKLESRLPGEISITSDMQMRRKWQPTPVFLLGESQGWGSLVAAVYGVTQSRTRLKRLSSMQMTPPLWQKVKRN